MKLIVQRVNKASVAVAPRHARGKKQKVVGKIDKGLFVLVGVGEGDEKGNAYLLAEKLSKMRIMADKNDKMNLSIKDVGGSILAVSQFTLFADTSKGNRPSFVKAADPKTAREIYKHFVTRLRQFDIKTETGSFGEYMNINVELDGPVTILLDSNK